VRTNDPGEVRIRRRLEPPSATRQTELTADESAGSGTNPRSTILVSIDYAELVKGSRADPRKRGGTPRHRACRSRRTVSSELDLVCTSYVERRTHHVDRDAQVHALTNAFSKEIENRRTPSPSTSCTTTLRSTRRSRSGTARLRRSPWQPGSRERRGRYAAELLD
jgi:hypothetical protein